MYPDQSILIARGQYATLSAERRDQLRRLQDICSTIVTAAQATLRDAEGMPPENVQPIMVLETCLANAKDARSRIVNLASEMVELKGQAWPG